MMICAFVTTFLAEFLGYLVSLILLQMPLLKSAMEIIIASCYDLDPATSFNSPSAFILLTGLLHESTYRFLLEHTNSTYRFLQEMLFPAIGVWILLAALRTTALILLSCCSISESHIGISFMYEDEGAVLGIIEAKVNGNLRHDIQQTAAYALCPLAYSRWGRWGNAQPLVALLLTPRCLYRLTFAKSNVSAFGIYMTIKYTDDVDQMEFELYNYIQKYIDDFHHVKDRKFKDHLYVNPLDWTPMNLQLADLPPYPSNLTRWQVPCMSKYGFLFRTSSDAVTALQAKHVSKARFPSLRAGKAVYVKYLSALLDYCYESSVVSLTLLLASDRGEKDRKSVV